MNTPNHPPQNISDTDPTLASQDPKDRLELVGLTGDEWKASIGALLKEEKQPAYRGKTLSSWVFKHLATSFDQMSDLPKAFRENLAQKTILHPLTESNRQVSEDGTEKFLWRLNSGHALESVFIPDGNRRTFCISTQAGCPVKCTFCATGYGGFDGQLTPGQIVDQVIQLSHSTGMLPTNIVFMGMGEPLLNAPNVYKSIEILTAPDQLGLGTRRLTLSTVGIPKRIIELAKLHPQVKLAVSLHATNDELRDEIIPLNKQYPLEMLLSSIKEHHRITGKKVTFEYIILPGVNDSEEDARALARIARSTPSRVNLIGFNPFPQAHYGKPTVPQIQWFRNEIATRFDGEIMIRRSRGEDIQGACGQLSLLHADDKS